MKKYKALIVLVSLFFLSACSSDNSLTEIKVKSVVITGGDVMTSGSAQLSVTVSPDNATKKSVTWSVSDTAAASISSTGLLTVLAGGNVIVTATAKDGSGVTGTKSFTLIGASSSIPVQSITISGGDITDGNPKQFTASVLPTNAINKNITWSVSSVAATISSEGLLTPKLNGTVTVFATATDGSGKVGQVTITISGLTVVYGTKVRSESILVWQRNNGGWGKAVPELTSYNIAQTSTQIATALSTKNSTDTTIDNGHVVTELRWLLADYKTTNNPNYLAAAEKAIDYLFLAQYANGGWPQYYPDMSSYRHQITYNDNAIVNVMNLMWDIQKKQNDLNQVNAKYVPLAITSFNKGIDVILKTQITSPSGKKTAWCAQHDEITLLPALARSYELPSVSGSESVGVIKVLMLVEQPSAAIKQAVKDAVDWFAGAKIFDIKTQTTSNPPDVIVVASPGSVLWARFYDLNTNLPFFCGRDGIKKATLAEIEIERRTGYSWYGNWPSILITTEYTTWKTKNGL